MIKPEIPTGNKPQTASIHIAQLSDAAAIAALAKELADYEGHATACDKAAIQSLLSPVQQPICRIIAAKIGQETVGFAICYPGYDLTTHSYGLHLADICVAAAHRRKGIGRQLIAAIGEQAQKEKRDWVSLTVLHDNKDGRAFYQRLGFVDPKAGLYAAGKRGIQAIVNASLS